MTALSIVFRTMRSLGNYTTQGLKREILRLLRARQAAGGRASIKKSVLQKALTKRLGVEPALGDSRHQVELALGRAIGALRREVPPKLQIDKGDGMIRLG